ncbi:hypothetical protein LOC67_26395 [Stieleria sp. JC731]|uniref:hypothetical protein n=1 Tax=Pirellulaceae TaxID=2691357 RepID=UPI001E5A3143|nr:hypothetical protein [Stieleria sp. JC731]MCC9604099.1 hypothetical protein [Stieleria sp. JC731]
MEHATDTSHLGKISPIKQVRGRALSLGFTLASNVFLMLVPIAIGFVGSLLPLVLAVNVFGSLDVKTFAAVLSLSVLTTVVALVIWATRFPEWPMNLWLDSRLRRRVLNRFKETGSSFDVSWVGEVPMCEYVRRDSMQAVVLPKLESASDIALVRITADGLVMEGDRARYDFPADSILGVSVKTIRPSGCFHKLHYVHVFVRTEKGTDEFPISRRDCPLGRLSVKKRHEDAVKLAAQIEKIAKGAECEMWDPDYQHRELAVDGQRHDSQCINPYAAPSAVL